jgi:glycosyltransferase involved in cell wall biosynthesis
MPRPPVSVTIITLNEEKNLPRAVASVRWADEIVVVDSGSTDRTVEIARGLGAKVFQHPWQGYGQQKNHAQKQATHDWVLNLDADEVVSPQLANEIQQTLTAVGASEDSPRGFYFPRKTYYLGRWIRHGGWYPNHLIRLANRRWASWSEPQVHEALEVQGPVASLKNPLDHYSFTSIHGQVLTNLNFSRLGARQLAQKGVRPSIFKLIFKPLGKFFETYVLKKGFLDGLPGFIIAVNAAHSIFLKYACLLETQIRRE